MQAKVVSNLAFNMKIVAVAALLGGAILSVAGLVVFRQAGRWVFVEGVLMLIAGALTLPAAAGFRRIARSGNVEVGQLMIALTALRNLYMFNVVLVLIGAIAVGLTLVWAIGH